MSLYRNAKISLKLAISFTAILMLLCAVIIFTWLQADRIGESSQKLAAGSLQKILYARNAQQAAMAGANQLHSLFLLPKADRVPVYTQIDQNTKIRDNALSDLLEAAARPEERAALDDVAKKRDRFVVYFAKTVNDVELNIKRARSMMLQDTMPALSDMLHSLDNLVALQANAANKTISDIRNIRMQAQQAILALGVAAIIVACFSAISITRSIARPISATVRFADAVAGGDFQAELPEANKDEMGNLVKALDHMRHSIIDREQRIADLAYRDPLTKLPNRTLFNDYLKHAVKVAMRTGHPVSVLVINLDRFRMVNDVLGSEMGDVLLAQVAEVMRKVFVRESDVIARLGGDEFAVLLPTENDDNAMMIAKRLLTFMESPIVLQGQPVDIDASIGIATCPDHGIDSQDLMNRADLAMYVAKKSSAGAMLFEFRFEPNVEHALSLLGQLRRAIEQEELMLYFQPKVSFADNMCRSVEALIRWQNSERGFVPPDEFIPFAERTGYIKTITSWAIEKACIQISKWRSEGLEIVIHVNISTRDLVNQDLPSIVGALLRRYSVSPDWLGLEITESAIMEDMAHAHNSLVRLNAMGIILSIDDFGSGYSSLNYLKQLPVHNIKIDKSFVMKMEKDKGDAIIVKSTIDLGHNLELKVVAEGVENQEIWNQLAEFGCDEAQGHFINRPMPVDHFEAWLKEWQTNA